MPDDQRPLADNSRPLPEYMSILVSERATGVLVISSSDGQRKVFFEDGDICSIQSSVEDEMLGAWLVQRGKISDGERALTLLKQGTGDAAQPLGALLVNKGSLNQVTLDGEMRALALNIIGRAAAATDVVCEFHEDLAADYQLALPNLSTPQIMLDCARAFPHHSAKIECLGSMDQAVWPARGLDSLLAELVLSPTEAFILSRLTGTDTMTNLIRLTSLPEEEAISTLFSLAITGVLNVGATPHPVLAPDTPRTRAQTAGISSVQPVDESRLGEKELNERRGIIELAEMTPRMDHYKALGITQEASHEEINDAWNDLSERYAPDRLDREHLRDLAAQLRTIVERSKEAHEVLGNPRARRRYDPILQKIEAERLALERGDVRGEIDAGARRELVEANFKRASELVKEGEIYLAIQLLEQACALEPRPAELLKLARLLLRNPLWTNRALNYIRKATKIDPDLVDGWIELAEFWRRRNNPDRQRKALEKALTADPKNTRAAKMFRLLAGKRELEKARRRIRARKI